MWLGISIYIILGVTLSFIGPVAKLISDTILDLKDHSGPYSNKDNTAPSKNSIVLIEIFFRLLIILFYPIAYIVALIDYSKKLRKECESRKQKKLNRDQKGRDLTDNKSYIYFKNIFGGGLVRCHVCGFKEEINISTHGFGDPIEFYDGYQCQLCGKFHTVTIYGNESTILNKCFCGGELSRDNPLFCPKCKGRDVSYQWTYMT